MKWLGLVSVVAMGTIVGAFSWGAGRPAPKNTSPVLVELFTSEGCSSCPPADAVLKQLDDSRQVIALGFHVDYWDHLGWRDPFSSFSYSQRQREYSRAFDTDEIYTPQMIVDGFEEFVGSDEAKARQAIQNAAQEPKASIQLTRVADHFTVRATDITNALPKGERAIVYAAITEDDLHSSVARGENAGRSLAHVAVVRRLTRLGTVTSGATFSGNFDLKPASGWKRNKLQVVAFVQAEQSRRIVGAAVSR